MGSSFASPSGSSPLPSGARMLLRRRFLWFAAPCFLVAAAVATVMALIPYGNNFSILIAGCGIVGAIAALFGWVGLGNWLEVRRVMKAVRRGEALARWSCPERHWELIDPLWKDGEPLGEVCLTAHGIYVGSDARDVLFAEWRSNRKHLSLVEVHSGNPSLLRIDISVPSRGRLAAYKIPIAIPIPLEYREVVASAVATLQDSDAVRPKGESWMDIILLVAGALTLVAAVLAKLGVVRW